MINLADLKSALSKVAEIGNPERTFTINGIELTLRVLKPYEEIEVQKKAMEALKEGEETNQVVAADYLQRFRVSTLSYAIVAIGELDLRNLKYVETGETLPNGVAVKIPKHEAIEEIVSDWGRDMLSAVFQKFGELTEYVESKVEGTIVYEPEVLENEIERLEARLKELKAKRTSEGAPKNEAFSQSVEVATKEEANQIDIKPESVLAEKGHPITPSAPRQSAIPISEAPPLEKHIPEPAPTRAPEPAQYDPRHDEAYQKEVEEENLRLLRERQAQAQQAPAKPEQIDGVEVYRMPTQTLDNRAPTPNQKPQATLNPNHSAPSNPNFKMNN